MATLKGLFSDKHKLARDYVDTFEANFFNDNIISEITNKMQSELSASVSGDIASLKVNAGAKQNKEVTEKIQSQTSKYVSSELLARQKQIIKIFSVHDKFHRTLILSGFCLLKIAKISLNSSFFPKPIKR